MASEKLKTFLHRDRVRDDDTEHSPAFTAPETAAAADIAGHNFAKTVIVEISGRPAMVVLPADRKIVVADLREVLNEQKVKLVAEAEFARQFPDCEAGAMPPFGNLYGLPVFIAKSLAQQDEIVFTAGTHHEVLRLSYPIYAALVKPAVIDFATTSSRPGARLTPARDKNGSSRSGGGRFPGRYDP